MIRTFIGVRVATNVGQTLDHWVERMRPAIDARRWYGIDQFHITIHFLGDQSTSQLEEIDSICHTVAKTFQSFSLQLASVGMFERSKVIWAGVKGDIPVLQHLYEQLQPIVEVAASNTFVRPKLTPHITLGRLKTIPSKLEFAKVSKMLEQVENPITRWTVLQIERFESVSSSNGVQYPTRMTYPLCQ